MIAVNYSISPSQCCHFRRRHNSVSFQQLHRKKIDIHSVRRISRVVARDSTVSRSTERFLKPDALGKWDERCSDRIMVILERFVTMESDSSIASWSSWELMDDDLSRIYIYEKEYRDYVVYFSANGDSPPSSTLKSFDYSSLESSGTITAGSFLATISVIPIVDSDQVVAIFFICSNCKHYI